MVKKIEVRKRFTSDYVGWLYIYCTKDKNNLLHKNCADIWWVEDKDFQKKNKRLGIKQQPIHNGKVVARFWCDKVEEHTDFGCMFPYSKLRYNKATCLSEEEIEDYGFIDGKGFVPLYAIHITNLEIFDKPKEVKRVLLF